MCRAGFSEGGDVRLMLMNVVATHATTTRDAVTPAQTAPLMRVHISVNASTDMPAATVVTVTSMWTSAPPRLAKMVRNAQTAQRTAAFQSVAIAARVWTGTQVEPAIICQS